MSRIFLTTTPVLRHIPALPGESAPRQNDAGEPHAELVLQEAFLSSQ